MIDFRHKKVVLLAPHTDDIELGMGGTLDKIRQDVAELHLFTFGNAVASLASIFPTNTLLDEQKASWKYLQQDEKKLTSYDFPVRDFVSVRQDILQCLVDINSTINPDCVFCPAQNDVHQDHNVITNEAKRAFKCNSIIGYELPWNYFQNPPETLIIELTNTNLSRKIEMLSFFESQRTKPYFDEDFIRGWAKYNGVRTGVQHAELFEIIRIVCA